jgi:MFS family permease
MQLGFFVGAIAFAIVNLADTWPSPRVFAANAVVGGIANALLVFSAVGIDTALILRFITGVCLAGVYRPAIKIAAGHAPKQYRGRVIGTVVAATTLGTGIPYLLSAVWGGSRLAERPVLINLSLLAGAGALVVWFLVKEGPYASGSARFDYTQVVKALRNRPVLLAGVGYYRHMWELYGFWAWLVSFLAAAMSPNGHTGEVQALVAAFVTVSIASPLASIAAGWLADVYGRTAVTICALVISGVCCLASPLAFIAPTWLLLAFIMVWGMAAVADSGQFSAAASELADPAYVGTVLTLQQGIGFAVTMVPLWGAPDHRRALGMAIQFCGARAGTGRGMRRHGGVALASGGDETCRRAPLTATARAAYDFASLGSIGVVPRTPNISSSSLAPASSFASPRGGATICRPTGRPLAVKPQGSDSAGQQASVIA